MTESLFRKALWTYVALTVLGAMALFFPGYSENLERTFDNEPLSWLMSQAWIWGIVLVPLAIGAVAGLIGLFLFKSWARPLSVLCTLAGYLICPFMGPALYTGLEDTLMSASTTIWGAILATSYFSAINDRFVR